MSTRSNIYLKLRDESKGKTIKFDKELLPDKKAVLNYQIPDVVIPENACYIGIYHHWDGYLSGVGQELLTKYTTYEQVLNLLSMGDMSSIFNDEGVCSYRGWRDEDCPPIFIESENLETDDALHESYAYLFDNGTWYYCPVHYEDIVEVGIVISRTEWKELTIEEIEKVEEDYY